MNAYEPCDACHHARAKVWWVGLPAEPTPADYGWLDLALCAHCTNRYAPALEALCWQISVDERGKDCFRPHAKRVPVHVS